MRFLFLIGMQIKISEVVLKDFIKSKKFEKLHNRLMNRVKPRSKFYIADLYKNGERVGSRSVKEVSVSHWTNFDFFFVGNDRYSVEVRHSGS